MRVADDVIALEGDVDARTDTALEAAFAEAAGAGTGAVTLDFSGATYINSTGIALIVALLARARTQRVAVHARGLSDHYREIFEITRLVDFMNIDEEGSA